MERVISKVAHNASPCVAELAAAVGVKDRAATFEKRVAIACRVSR